MRMDRTGIESGFSSERISRAAKEANDFLWYRQKIDMYEAKANFNSKFFGDVSEYQRMKVNYDLFNNIVDLKDFEYVCTPYGSEVGEMPAQMTNKDITSYRIKALLGMEIKRNPSYRLIAINPEATTRKEEEETSRITQFVNDTIMGPIKHAAQIKMQQEIEGREISEEEKQQALQKMQQEIEAQTPDRIRMFMKRNHQDPAEVQGNQLLKYLTIKEETKRKFNKGWKHATLSAYEVYWLGIIKGHPKFKVVNPLRFACDKSSDLDFIEEGEWAVAEYKMHPSEVIAIFDLTNKEIDEVWKQYHKANQEVYQQGAFDFANSPDNLGDDAGCLTIKHVNFRGLRKIGWLDYFDQDDVLQTRLEVDESYKLDPDNGDVKIEWEWVDEVYEGWKILPDVYKGMQPVPGQARDPEDIRRAPLSYYGAIYDNVNSQPTSLMDRMKVYQYYYNIIMYRVEMMMASDKGKKVLMNISAIPSKNGMDLSKWQYFFESSPFMWYDTEEEGFNQADVNSMAKVVDLSLASDIQKYIDLAEYLEQKCGKCIGVTDPVLGQTSVSESVGNNQQNLVQTSYMLEPYFDLHNTVKRNVLQGLVNLAKVAYAGGEKKVLSYVLDDMSLEMLKLDPDMLEETVYNLFVEDSSASEEIRQTIVSLTQAAMQNQKVELSDVLKVIKQSSLQEAEEALVTSEELREQRMQAAAKQEQEAKALAEDKARQHEKDKWQHETDNIILKEKERRITELQKQAMLSMGFNEDKDIDKDGTPDIFELYKNGVDAKLAMSKEARENRELDFQIKDAGVKNKLKEKEIAAKKATKSK